MPFRFREECHGYHHGQSDCVIIAYDGDKPVGTLEYSSMKKDGRKEAYIQMVQVSPSHQRQGIGAELVRQLAKSIPYEAIDWGMTTPDGTALQAKMDQEFGTSYKPVEKDEEPDPFDPKYNDDLDNSKYHADLTAWRQRNGYLDESWPIYSNRGTRMKVKEFKRILRESIQQAMQTMPPPQEETLTFFEEANVLYERHIGFKNLVNKLMGKGMDAEKAKGTAYNIGVKKYGKEKMSQAAAAHKPLTDQDAKKKPLAWNNLAGVAENKGSCPKCGSQMTYDDGRDAYTCPQCGYIGPNGPVNEMKNQGNKPHYKEQPSSKHGTPVKKKGME